MSRYYLDKDFYLEECIQYVDDDISKYKTIKDLDNILNEKLRVDQ